MRACAVVINAVDKEARFLIRAIMHLNFLEILTVPLVSFPSLRSKGDDLGARMKFRSHPALILVPRVHFFSFQKNMLYEPVLCAYQFLDQNSVMNVSLIVGKAFFFCVHDPSFQAQ